MPREILFILFAFVLWTTLGHAQTHIGGEISGRLTFDGSPYVVDLDGARDFIVPNGDTLIIDAGVRIVFQERGGASCFGVIIANGTAENPIDFTSEEGNWYGISVGDPVDTTKYESIFRHTLFGAYDFFIQGHGAALYCGGYSWIYVDNCHFWGNCEAIIASNFHIQNSSFGRHGEFFSIRIDGTPDESSYIRKCVFLEECDNPIYSRQGGFAVINCLFNGRGFNVGDSVNVENCIFHNCNNAIILGNPGDNDAFRIPRIVNNIFFSENANHINSSEGASAPEGFSELTQTNLNADSVDVYGNLFLDPLLVEEGEFPEPYFLTIESPCIDAGNMGSEYDPDSTFADIGPFFFPQGNIRCIVDSVVFEGVQTGERLEQIIEISNVGLVELNVSDYYIIPENSDFVYEFVEDEVWEVPPGSSFEMYVWYIPREEGISEAVFTIETDDRDTPNIEVNLFGSALKVYSDLSDIPQSILLSPAFPNPFNSKTRVSYQLPGLQVVDVSIYNMSGERIATLEQVNRSAGYYDLMWDAAGVASGVYFVRLMAGDFVGTQKVVLVR
ncbi:MAG: T9SS type A sorting domain-containing protein [Calditrichaeota bacterium]|nr:T9SS type A sorting domain-containing protein [Calditrichota bacterium]